MAKPVRDVLQALEISIDQMDNAQWDYSDLASLQQLAAKLLEIHKKQTELLQLTNILHRIKENHSRILDEMGLVEFAQFDECKLVSNNDEELIVQAEEFAKTIDELQQSLPCSALQVTREFLEKRDDALGKGQSLLCKIKTMLPVIKECEPDIPKPLENTLDNECENDGKDDGTQSTQEKPPKKEHADAAKKERINSAPNKPSHDEATQLVKAAIQKDPYEEFGKRACQGVETYPCKVVGNKQVSQSSPGKTSSDSIQPSLVDSSVQADGSNRETVVAKSPDAADEGEDEAHLAAEEKVFWRALRQKHWGWALALAQSCENVVEMPAWLLEALQLTHHSLCGSAHKRHTEYLLNLIHEHYKPSEEQSMVQFPKCTGPCLASAAIVASFAPDIGAQANSWLADALQFPDAWVGLETTHSLLVQAQKRLAIIEHSVWETIDNTLPLERKLKETTGAIKDWKALLEAPRANFAPAGAAMKELVSDRSGVVYPLIEIIAQEDISYISDVRNKLKEFPQSLPSLIQKYSCKNGSKRGLRIEGQALKNMVARLEHLRELVETWLTTAQQLKRANDQGSVIASDFKKRWKEIWPDVCRELSSQPDNEIELPETVVVRQLLAGALNTVARQIMDCEESCAIQWGTPRVNPTIECEQVRWYVAKEWNTKLVDYDYPLPPINATSEEIEKGYSLFGEGIGSHVQRLLDQKSNSLALRILEVSSVWADYPPEELEKVRERAEDEWEKAHAQLQEQNDKLFAQLREALAQGWLDTTSHREADEKLQKTSEELASGTYDDQVLTSALRSVKDLLLETQTQKAKQVAERAQDICQRSDGQAEETKEHTQRWIDQAHKHIKTLDIGLAEHALGLAEDALQGNVQNVFEADNEEFGKWLEQMEELERSLIDSRNPNPLKWGGIPTPRREQYNNMKRAFVQLRRIHEEKPQVRAPKAEGILRSLFMDYIGFEVNSIQAVDINPNNKHQQSFTMNTKQITSRDRIPVPLFGSQADGEYNIEVVWERPSAETLLQELENSRSDVATFFVYVGRMTCRKRSFWLRKAPTLAHCVPCIVIDEILLHYLGPQKGDRIRILFDCALPYTTINPYKPTGPVQPELFYGREDALQALEDPNGPCIVYGGRQLGKSALLRRLSARRHQPKDGSWVIYQEIRGQDSSACWGPLREWLATATKSKMLRNTPDEIVKAVKTVLEPSSSRLLLLLDESDSFIADDARGNFENIWRLRALMDETNRRFKVVLAGLQDVQRYSNSVNHPLAQMGSPINIGPLSLNAATQLIRRPASSLGFDIDSSASLKIRVYTDSHPGLIQYFCQQLLSQKMKQRAHTGQEIVTVKASDVDLIYGKAETRQEISNRFCWTVVLDPQYKALVYSLLYDLINQEQSINQAFTPRQALAIANDWCPQLFKDTTLNQMASLLAELEGLGILQRFAGEERWRVRNSQVVALMGGKEVIEDRLEEVLAEPEPIYPRPSEQHLRFGKQNTPCPVSLEELSEIAGIQIPSTSESVIESHSGCLLLHTSRTLGSIYLWEALNEITGSGNMTTFPWELVPALSLKEIQPQALAKEIYRLAEKSKRDDAKGKLIWLRFDNKGIPSSSLRSCIKEIASTISQLKEKSQRSVRVVLELNPWSSWKWLEEKKNNNTPEICTEFEMRRWRRRDFEIWVRNEQFANTDNNLTNELLKLTGGWYEIIIQFRKYLSEECGGELTHTDPKPYFKSFSDLYGTNPDAVSHAGFIPIEEFPPVVQYLWEHLDKPVLDRELETISELSDNTFALRDLVMARTFLSLIGYLNPVVLEETGGEIAYEAEPVVARYQRGVRNV